MPAQAGIQAFELRRLEFSLDSRLRGNDGLVMTCPVDVTTGMIESVLKTSMLPGTDMAIVMTETIA